MRWVHTKADVYMVRMNFKCWEINLSAYDHTYQHTCENAHYNATCIFKYEHTQLHPAYIVTALTTTTTHRYFNLYNTDGMAKK